MLEIKIRCGLTSGETLKKKKKNQHVGWVFFKSDGNENLDWMKSDRHVKILKALKF